MEAMINTLTFSDMVQLEPRLAALREQAREIWHEHYDSRKELERAWYRDIKRQMLSLVGFGSAVPELRNATSYDYCYQFLYALLMSGQEVN
jgi:hypothetical protein